MYKSPKIEQYSCRDEIYTLDHLHLNYYYDLVYKLLILDSICSRCNGSTRY